MKHTTTFDLPADVWEDLRKRKFQQKDGKSYTEIMVKAYRAFYLTRSRPEAEHHISGKTPEPGGGAPVTPLTERPVGPEGAKFARQEGL